MKTTAFLIVFSLLLQACSSTPSHSSSAGPYVKPGLVIIPADQAHLYGLSVKSATKDEGARPPDVKATDASSVLVETPPSAIQFNRYVDPSDKDLMHESHIVYRREASAHWRLQPAPGGQILVGPQLTAGTGEIQPLASQELDSYLLDQRSTMLKQQMLMAKVGDAVGKLAEQQQQLAVEIGKLKTEQSAKAEASASAPNPSESDAKPHSKR